MAIDIETLLSSMEWAASKGLSAYRFSTDGVQISLERGAASRGTVIEAPRRAALSDATSPQSANDNTITAPLSGACHLKPESGGAPFISVGQTIALGETICVIEAMKVMTSIAATKAGTVTEIMIEDGAIVTAGGYFGEDQRMTHQAVRPAIETAAQDAPAPCTDRSASNADTVLVANRGEIALRIIRACRRLGLRVVCAHSEVDRDAPYLKLADASICIGPRSGAEKLSQYPRLDRRRETDRRDDDPSRLRVSLGECRFFTSCRRGRPDIDRPDRRGDAQDGR